MNSSFELCGATVNNTREGLANSAQGPDLPAVLCAQPHRTLIGLGVNGQQVFQTPPRERPSARSPDSSTIHGALAVVPVLGKSAGDGQKATGVLLFFGARGLGCHIFGPWDLLIWQKGGHRTDGLGLAPPSPNGDASVAHSMQWIFPTSSSSLLSKARG